MAAADAPRVTCETREEWRDWLEANHASETAVWLVTWKPAAGRPVLSYEAAVEEALCFGWVDSTGRPVDDLRWSLYFAQRKPRSGWARSNKERVERLIADGRMAPAGLAAIERARENGSWTLLDDVENLVVPEDLAAALAAHPPAADHWATFPRSARRAMLEWIVQARRSETRVARIAEAATAAARNERAYPRPPRA
jgi:uncharacterized protein YdeI (YjbR/CyaY-like superfamily)